MVKMLLCMDKTMLEHGLSEMNMENTLLGDNHRKPVAKSESDDLANFGSRLGNNNHIMSDEY